MINRNYSNSYWLDDIRPCLTFAMRGVIHLVLSISSKEIEDFHSGVHGGAVSEPMIDLVQLLSKFTDDSGGIMIPGFYESVRDEVPEHEQAIYGELKKQ